MAGTATILSQHSCQGIFNIVKLDNVTDAQTYTIADTVPVLAYWAMSIGDPSTNTSAGVNVTFASGTFTLYPGVNSLDCFLFIVVGTT